MTEHKSMDEVPPDEVYVEAMRAFHVGGVQFGVSVELSDEHKERGRSFLLLVDSDGRQVRFDILLQLENQMLSHVSTSPQDHVLLEVGGLTHFLRGTSHTTARAPEPFFHKLFLPPGGPLFTYGEDGSVCRFEANAWRPIEPLVPAFLRTMHGPSVPLLHVAGNHGTLLHLRGDRWHRIPLDFNRSIETIHVSADATVSIGCEDGLCFEFRDSALREIKAPDSDFMSIADFKGARYWGDNDFGVLVQDDRTLKKFRALDFAYAMEPSDELLVITGWKEVFAFDGHAWTGFEFGYDGELYAAVIDMDGMSDVAGSTARTVDLVLPDPGQPRLPAPGIGRSASSIRTTNSSPASGYSACSSAATRRPASPATRSPSRCTCSRSTSRPSRSSSISGFSSGCSRWWS